MIESKSEICQTFNISCDLSKELSLRLSAVWEQLPNFVGNREDRPYWFGDHSDDQHLSASTQHDGLCIRGFLDIDSWQQWRKTFLQYTSAALGFAVMNANEDPRFWSSGHPFLHIERYNDQLCDWPTAGQHILAQFDDHSIVVYQAYRPSIGRFAAEHQYFGGDFSFQRMSWIKPNFLWMMYRSGWGTKVDQEVTLAIRLRRSAFDEILKQAVHSSFTQHVYANESDWQRAVANSNVRLQWDPDHNPSGAKLERRAIQLGLREDVLAKFAREWIIEICDISDFVAVQRSNVHSLPRLLVPHERVYLPSDSCVASRLGISEIL